MYYRMVGTVKSQSTLTSDSLTRNTLVSQRLAEPNPALPNQTGLIPTIPENPLPSAADESLKLTGANWVEVYERLQAAIKVRHYSNKTWQAYRYWLQQFQTYTKSKDARLLDMDDVKGFLSHLAMNKQVAASSQNQAFNALLFLFKHVLQKEFAKVEGVVRAKSLTLVPDSKEYRRYHLHETHVQQAIKLAVRRSRIAKRALAHSFRHSFASHLLQAKHRHSHHQELLGHSDLKTTMIYTHTVPSQTIKEAKSPLDF